MPAGPTPGSLPRFSEFRIRAPLRPHPAGTIEHAVLCSFFLQTSEEEPRKLGADLSVLRDEIGQLEAQIDRKSKEIRLERAEGKISQHASEALSFLPTVAPCVGSELYFSSKEPEVCMIEAGGTGSMLSMPDVGSDQNYLAIHIAIAFGAPALLRRGDRTRSRPSGV